MQDKDKSRREDEKGQDTVNCTRRLVGARLGLAVASPGTITGTVSADDLVRVELDGASNSLASGVTVLANHVDDLRDHRIGSCLDGLVVEHNSVGGSVKVPVNIQSRLDTVAISIASVPVPSDNHQAPPLVQILDLLWANVSVRRTDASRHSTNDPPQSIFHQLNLLVKLLVVHQANVGMVPGVRANLVPLLVRVTQALNRSIVVNAAVVVTVDEERRLLVAGVAEGIDDLARVEVRAVVEGDGEALGRGAASDVAVDLSAAFGGNEGG